MKRISLKLLLASLTFSIGCALTAFWIFIKYPIQNAVINDEIDQSQIFHAPPKTRTSRSEPRIETESRIENILPTMIEKMTDKKRVPIKRHESFEDVIGRLKKLATFMGETGEQTFYISDVENDGEEFARAYWKQKNAIIGLHLPIYGEPTEAELYWLSGKAYTDLDKEVVPEELGTMGCCLVTKAWAVKTVKACRAGYRLKFNVEAQSK